jgi:hypothetical protein
MPCLARIGQNVCIQYTGLICRQKNTSYINAGGLGKLLSDLDPISKNRIRLMKILDPVFYDIELATYSDL